MKDNNNNNNNTNNTITNYYNAEHDVCLKCNREYNEKDVIRTVRNECRDCNRKYHKENREIKKHYKKEKESIELFDEKVIYLINKIKLNNLNVSLSDMNDLITYYQLHFEKTVKFDEYSMREQILLIYNSLSDSYKEKIYSNIRNKKIKL